MIITCGGSLVCDYCKVKFYIPWGEPAEKARARAKREAGWDVRRDTETMSLVDVCSGCAGSVLHEPRGKDR
jgi:hypothetical protein